jgi:hypothetical protein
MSTPDLPLIVPLALTTGFVLLLIVMLTSGAGVGRPVSRSFWCPRRGAQVTAEFQEDVWDGRRLDVTRCSAFDPPTAVACDKVCLRTRRLRRMRLPGADALRDLARRGRAALRAP